MASKAKGSATKHVSQQLATEIVEQELKGAFFASNKTNCWLSTKAPTKNNGYIQANLPNGKKALIHHLSIIADGRKDDLANPDLEVSHLCHHRNCFNPEHLHMEDKEANNRRKNCLIYIQCPCCDCYILVCRHNPGCVGSRIP